MTPKATWPIATHINPSSFIFVKKRLFKIKSSLAAMEAWNRLMTIEEEDDEILDEEVLHHMRNVQEYGEFLRGRWKLYE